MGSQAQETAELKKLAQSQGQATSSQLLTDTSTSSTGPEPVEIDIAKMDVDDPKAMDISSMD